MKGTSNRSINRDGSPLTEIGRVDVWAHLLGLAAGLLLGLGLFAVGMRRGISARLQVVFGVLALGALAGAWCLALH